ncbi:MAG: hypothetical protein NZ899_01485 [Thermoguttaceae bacterium]|nr:hypothetical protein [Thermoguttaceae bacterium]MDW8078606.1 DUF6798 domain-containing protein [Thermoguttaceae bacterium]
MRRFRRGITELAAFGLLYLAIALQGAWPVPDVNEPHYVGKMIAFWNPSWVQNDPFLSSADAHPIFYAVFGWPSRFLEAESFTWLARAVGWLLVAGGWYVFARQLLPSPWAAMLSGLLFGLLQERFNMAGEWVIGGIEAKVPAYGFVFFGLAALVRGWWNIAFVSLGLASAFHVLAGGWALIAAVMTWLIYNRREISFWQIVPGGAIGCLLAFPNVMAALRLSWGVEPEVLREAYQIYLYRLGHHLSVFRIPSGALDRFLLLTFLWYLLQPMLQRGEAHQILRIFVLSSLGIAGVGGLLSLLELINAELAATLLRYYLFRLADVMVPAAVAIAGGKIILAYQDSGAPERRVLPFLLWCIAAIHVVYCGYSRLAARMPRADENQVEDYDAWRDVCRWVATSDKVPEGSRFLTPRTSYTFRWYARRADVVNWKDIPQDAPAIVRWWHTLCKVHAYRDATGRLRWLPNLAYAGAERLQKVAREVGAEFAIAPTWPPLDLPILYKNETYAVYHLTQPAESPR